MKIYVVKYALTEGIIECVGEPCGTGEHPMKMRAFMDSGDVVLDWGEYDFDLDDARSKAYAKRDKKIASLKKQIAKLEKMEF